MEPEHLTFQLLQEFTNDFADEHKVGEGAYGVVYKGVTKNGDDVAVKKLRDNLVFDETQFRNEFHNLKMLTHQNIVQFLGYCYETKQLPIKCNGRALLAETRYRALCFEYLHKGCLNKYLSDEFRGLDWNTRYKIIKGTCQGLKYIHEELDKPLYHLDLKPDNILLDKDMVPKIADFGLSRIFCKQLTQTAPGQLGTLGYQPPEHIEKGEISEKFDIFSLGVIIIKIVSGPEGYSKCACTSNNEFIDLVKTNWRSRLQATWSGSSLDAYCDQVERCTEIALSCVEHDSHERPSIANIIDRLSETETEIGKSVLLQVEPLQLHFPFEQDNLMVSCSLQLTNNTDNQVVFRLVTKNPEYFLGPLCGVVASRCRYTLAVTRRDKLLNPSMNRDEYFTLESSKASDHEIQYEISNDMESYNHFFLEAKENGRDMHKVKLTAIYGPPELGKTTNKTVGEYDKGVTLFTMHDLVHDLARLVMGDKLITEELRGLYAFLPDSRKSLELSINYYLDKIRALRFLHFGYIELEYMPFSFAKSLRVLDLSECRKFFRLPVSLGGLVQLRYLNAPNTEWVADCFTELSKLIYLNLSGFQMDKLPWSIGTVEGLIYLDISNSPQIVSLPESFVNLKKLVHLDCSNCTRFVFHHQGSVGDVFDVLTNLQYLNVSRQRGCWYISPFTSPLPMVQKTIGSFSKLRYLNLSYALSSTLQSEIDETFSFIDCICTLSTLEHLDLSHNYNIVNVPESIGRLRKLHTLNLSFCIRLLRLPECMVRMYSLRNLNVTGCSNLDKSTFSRSKIVVLFPHFMVHTNDDESSSNIGLLRDANPEELHISRLDNVKSAAEVKSIELIEKRRIEDLKLEWTKDDFRSVEDVEVLDDLVPPSSVRKFDLKGYNSVGFPPWVMDMKLYLPNLIKIVLCDLCKCNSLPPLGQLPKLQEVVMEGMDSITAIDEGFCGVERAFPVLKKFHIHRMENLETWNTKYSYDNGGVKKFMFPNLEEVSIGDCPKLRLKPCPPRAKRWGIENASDVLGSRVATTNIFQVIFKKLSTWGKWGETCSSYSAAPNNVTLRVKSSKLPLRDWRLLHHLPPISELRIIGCNDLTCSSRKIIQYLPRIESLWLEDIFDPELPKWLGDLISLRELIIRRCTELNGLQQSMQQLTSLQLLCLNGCPSITKIPEWLGTLSSLKELVIWDCTGIKSLPTSILPKLELLYIYYCPELVDWCEQEENKHKLAHIENQVYAVSHSPGTWYHEEFRVPANGVTDTYDETWWDQGSCGSAAEFDWPEDGVTDTCGESSCDQGSCGSAAELIREAALPEDGVTDTIDGSLCDQGSSRSAAELTTEVQGTRHGRAATRECSATSGCSEYTYTLQVDEPAVEEGCGVHSAGGQARPEVGFASPFSPSISSSEP